MRFPLSMAGAAIGLTMLLTPAAKAYDIDILTHQPMMPMRMRMHMRHRQPLSGILGRNFQPGQAQELILKPFSRIAKGFFLNNVTIHLLDLLGASYFPSWLETPPASH